MAIPTPCRPGITRLLFSAPMIAPTTIAPIIVPIIDALEVGGFRTALRYPGVFPFRWFGNRAADANWPAAVRDRAAVER